MARLDARLDFLRQRACQLLQVDAAQFEPLLADEAKLGLLKEFLSGGEGPAVQASRASSLHLGRLTRCCAPGQAKPSLAAPRPCWCTSTRPRRALRGARPPQAEQRALPAAHVAVRAETPSSRQRARASRSPTPRSLEP